MRIVAGGHAHELGHLVLGQATLLKGGLAGVRDLGGAVIGSHGALELLLVGAALGERLHAHAMVSLVTASISL